MTSGELQIVINITPENIELKQYICNESCCNQMFTNEQSLKKHLINHYETDETARISYNYSCPVSSCRRCIVNEHFQTRKQLVQHFYKVHYTKKLECGNKNCDKKFSTEVLRNLHLKSCGKVFSCDFCTATYSTNEALITHCKRKNHTKPSEVKKKKSKESPVRRRRRSVATATTSTVTNSSVGTNTTSSSATKSTITEDVFLNQHQQKKLIKNSSTSTEDFMKEESSNSLSSSSSQNKKTNVNWSLTGGFEEDSITLFDNDVKMEFYSTETQTDFSESLFNNNCTQTTFADFYDFEKFDGQTQTNWDEFNQGF